MQAQGTLCGQSAQEQLCGQSDGDWPVSPELTTMHNDTWYKDSQNKLEMESEESHKESHKESQGSHTENQCQLVADSLKSAHKESHEEGFIDFKNLRLCLPYVHS